MSGLTREVAIELERQARQVLRDNKKIAEAVLTTLEDTRKQEEEERHKLRQELTNAVTTLDRDIFVVDERQARFTNMRWQDRWRWLFTGKLPL